MATGKPVKIAYVADTSDLRRSLAQAETAMESSAATAKTAGQKIDTAFDSTASHADDVASKGSQAAGALSGLGDLVGGKFGAAMVVGGTAMQGFADAGDLVNVVTESAIFRKIKDTAVTAAQTVATLAQSVAQKAVAAATWVWTAAQTALNAVLAGNPIALVVIALVALVAALVIAYQKSETFRNIVNGAFGAIKDFVMPVVNTIKTAVTTAWDAIKTGTSAAWNAIKGFVNDPMGTIKSFVTGSVDTIKSGITGAWDTIKTKTSNVYEGIKTTITDKFDDIVTFIKGVPGRLLNLAGDFKEAGTSLMNAIINGIKNAAGFIGSIGDSIWGAVKGLINQAIDKINAALEFTINIPGAPDISINAPNIPHLAKGGIVSRPTLALIGEAGPEAVVPLNGRYGMGGNVYQINVTAPVGSSPEDVGKTLMRYIEAAESAGGRRRAS